MRFLSFFLPTNNWHIQRFAKQGAAVLTWMVCDEVTRVYCLSDHQKLEREARICRLLKHPNIGEYGQYNHLTESWPLIGAWQCENKMTLLRIGLTMFSQYSCLLIFVSIWVVIIEGLAFWPTLVPMSHLVLRLLHLHFVQTYKWFYIFTNCDLHCYFINATFSKPNDLMLV